MYRNVLSRHCFLNRWLLLLSHAAKKSDTAWFQGNIHVDSDISVRPIKYIQRQVLAHRFYEVKDREDSLYPNYWVWYCSFTTQPWVSIFGLPAFVPHMWILETGHSRWLNATVSSKFYSTDNVIFVVSIWQGWMITGMAKVGHPWKNTSYLGTA